MNYPSLSVRRTRNGHPTLTSVATLIALINAATLLLVVSNLIHMNLVASSTSRRKKHRSPGRCDQSTQITMHKIKSGISSELGLRRERRTLLLGEDACVACPPIFNLRQAAHHVTVTELSQRIIADVAVASMLAFSIHHGDLDC
jgi:hypothetical protein